MSVADPRSPNYGHHLSNEEVHALVAPLPADIETVHNFLREAGAPPRNASPNSDFVSAVMNISTAERLLRAQYFELAHAKSGVRGVHRCVYSSYRVPAAVAAAVDFIAPSVHVPGVRSPRAAGTPADASRLESEDEGAFVEPEFDDVAESQRGMRENVPTTLRQLYSVGDVVGQAGADQSSNHGDLSQWPLPPMRASSTAPWVGLSVFGSGQPDGSDSFPGPAILSGACTLRRTTECTCAAAPPLTPSHTISRPACGPSSADRAPALPQALLPPPTVRRRPSAPRGRCHEGLLRRCGGHAGH